MSTNNNPKKNISKFNINWLYLIIFISIGILLFNPTGSGASKEVTYTEFKEMVMNGYADKIVAYNDYSVDMYVKPEFVQKIFKENAKRVGRSPIVHVEVGSLDALDTFLTEAQKEGHFNGSVKYEKKSDIWSLILWNTLPFIFLIGLYIFMVRRMSGGSGGGMGGANPFNVGKSRAQMYENQDEKSRITFKDVAGQDEAK